MGAEAGAAGEVVVEGEDTEAAEEEGAGGEGAEVGYYSIGIKNSSSFENQLFNRRGNLHLHI